MLTNPQHVHEVMLRVLVQPNNTPKIELADNNETKNEPPDPESPQLAPTELSDTSVYSVKSEESSNSGSLLVVRIVMKTRRCTYCVIMIEVPV